MPGSEKRKARRFDDSLPVKVRHDPSAPTDTYTKDISAKGAYLFLTEKIEVGSELVWDVTFASAMFPGNVRLHCRGTVVRVDAADRAGRIGVAVSLNSYEFVREPRAT